MACCVGTEWARGKEVEEDIREVWHACVCSVPVSEEGAGGWRMTTQHSFTMASTLHFSMSEMGSHKQGVLSSEVYNLTHGFKGAPLTSE